MNEWQRTLLALLDRECKALERIANALCLRDSDWARACSKCNKIEANWITPKGPRCDDCAMEELQ